MCYAWSITIAERTDDESHNDRTCHSNNVLILEAPALKPLIVLLDVALEWCESEPTEEGEEEGEPREVEGAHVRSSERQDLQCCRLVVGIDRKGKRFDGSLFFDISRFIDWFCVGHNVSTDLRDKEMKCMNEN